MRYLPVTIRDKIAEYMSSEKMICYNSDYILQFTFDAEWDSYTQKTAQIRYFSTNKGWVKHDIIFTGMECNVPVIPNANVVYVGVYAGDIRTTTEAEISCRPSVLSYDGAPVNPPDDVYNQIMQKLNEIEQSGATPEQIAAAIEKYLTENPITASDVNAVPQNQGAENAGKFLGVNESGEVVPVESGADGITPHIGANGNWYIGETDTGIKAQGEKGADGTTPHIGENGDWYIGETDTGIKAQGEKGEKGDPGEKGTTPHIGENGNWWIGDTDTGVKAVASGGSGTDIALGITGATVGQIARITAVDDAGIPTAWEAVDMTSGSGEQWELLVDYVTEEQVFNSTIPYIVFSQDDNVSPIKCKAVYVEINGIVIRDGSNDIHIRYWFNDVPVWGSYVTDNGRYSVTFCMFAIRSNGMASAILLDSRKDVSTRSFEYTNIEINTIKIGSNNQNAVFLEPNANIRIYGVRV